MLTYDDYKPIRNRIRKFRGNELLLLAVKQLHDIYDAPRERVSYWRPWDLMRIIEWIIDDGNFDNTRKQPDINTLADLMNRINELETRLPNEYSGTSQFIRVLVHQQFLYQRSAPVKDLARQLAIFGEARTPKGISEKFEAQVKVPLKTYLAVNMLLGSQILIAHKMFIPSSCLESLYPVYGRPVVTRSVELLSETFEGARARIRAAKDKIKDFDARFQAPTALQRRPFLREPDRMICLSPSLLVDLLRFSAFDLFREVGGSDAASHLGEAFEDYIARVLEFTGMEHRTERHLRARYPGRKVTDFAIPSENATVLVEAKAIETSRLAQASPDERVLVQHIRSSVLKAVGQGLAAASAISASPDDVLAGHVDEFFLLVVTMKDLHLGPGQGLIQGPVEAEIREAAKGLDMDLVPRENTFFCTVEELEFLVDACATSGVSMASVLRRARQANADPATRRLHLSQHFEAQGLPTRVLPLLVQLFQRFGEEVKIEIAAKLPGAVAPVK
ncbi:hypothetical protein [Corallococcus exercitus]|uniref:hypothetical protein n=1 Tax=Corallococcus exercitus TaxID=2316736 RepID=UPI0035D4F87C